MQLPLPNENLKAGKRVSFNEHELAEHDKERGTRMVIPDPDTPFMRSPVMSDDDESPRVPRHQSPRQLMSEVISQQPPTVREDEEVQKRQDFAAKRKSHYNEFLVLKGVAEPNEDGDDTDTNRARF